MGEIRPGQLVGTALALTGDPSPVDATFVTPARYLAWSLGSIRSFVDRRPELRVTLQGLVSRDLARKLGEVIAPRGRDVPA